jgi:predicted ribosomally synthesized peptide with nif11-like leader
MSVQSARAFYMRMASDPKFLAQLEASTAAGRRALVRSCGYDFDESDFRVASHELQEATELSEEELEIIAGGVGVQAVLTGRYGPGFLFDTSPMIPTGPPILPRPEDVPTRKL